jgi:hypothetical protein
VADEDEMLQCGHYLIHGAESLCCLWDGHETRAVKAYNESRERRRMLGIPTVFECNVPVRWLEPNWRDELASSLVTFYFKLESASPEGPETWSRVWGFWISRTLPPGNLKRHYHPGSIPDPLNMNQEYRPPVTHCPYCLPRTDAS